MRLTLSSKQVQRATIAGVVIFLVCGAAVGAWLSSNAEQTIQTRLAQIPSVTIALKTEDEKEKVPESWQSKDADPEIVTKAEEPKAPSPPPVEQKESAEINPEPPLPEPVAQVEKPVEKPAEKPAEKVVEQENAALPESVPVQTIDQPDWQKYARPFDQQTAKPRIAIIIPDMGLAAMTTQTAIQDLPGEVTLAFSALAPNLEADMLKTRAAGHEMLMMIPMEPVNYPQNDAGSGSLLTSLSDADNVVRLKHALSRSDGYIGIMPSMGEKFVTLESKLAPVFDVLNKEGLLIIDGTQSSSSLIAPLSRLAKIPFARTDAVIDVAARGLIDQELTKIETIAQESGQAVAIIKPYPVVFEKLVEWIQTLQDKNIVLAPISAVSALSAPALPQAVQQPTETLEATVIQDPAVQKTTDEKPAESQ
jgi:polysaccharide deacetylase 2 family uncharacterized protein YibQ